MSALALIGNLAVDRIAAGAPRSGGGVFHGARAAERVGADAVVVTRCAEADRHVALAPLEATGIPVLCADAHETTAFSFHYDGDRRVMSVDAVGDPWTVADVDGWAAEALRDARWVLVAGLLRSHFPADTLAALARGVASCSTGRGSCASPGAGRSSGTPTSTAERSSTSRRSS
jgi:hypothetical protein